MKCYSLTFRQIAMKMCAYTWNQYRMHVLEVLNVNFSLFSRCLKEKKIVWGRCMTSKTFGYHLRDHCRCYLRHNDGFITV